MVKIFVQIMRKNCFKMHHLLLFICIKQVFSLYLILKICLDQEVALIKTDHHLNIFNYNQNKLIRASFYWVFKYLFLSKISKAKAWSNKERLLLHYDHKLHLVLEAIKFTKKLQPCNLWCRSACKQSFEQLKLNSTHLFPFLSSVE